jgi:hypothetical protein
VCVEELFQANNFGVEDIMVSSNGFMMVTKNYIHDKYCWRIHFKNLPNSKSSSGLSLYNKIVSFMIEAV